MQKKICMLGSFSVGKTSLIRRYVQSIFSEKYLTTVGVKIDKKQIRIDDTELKLMLWDLAGEDEFATIRPTQLRGMAGYVLVIDGSRKQSFEVAMALHQTAREQMGDLPMVFALNKADLKTQWMLDEAAVETLRATGYPVIETSARLGANVEALFLSLGRQLLDSPVKDSYKTVAVEEEKL